MFQPTGHQQWRAPLLSRVNTCVDPGVAIDYIVLYEGLFGMTFSLTLWSELLVYP